MKTELSTIKRVPFDATNKKHREHAWKFIKTLTWEGDLRFELDEERWNNIPVMIQYKLIEYYTNMENEDGASTASC